MAGPPDRDTLSDLPLFAGLASDELLRLAGLFRAKAVPADTLLMSAEQPGEAVYVVVEGTVKVYLEHGEGEQVILALLGPGDLVGEMSVLGDSARCANVLTLERTDLLWADARSFRQCLRTTPALCYNLAGILASRLRFANERVEWLAALDVEKRVARQLLALARQLGRPAPDGSVLIPIRLTQTDIASMVGATREHVNKIVASYKARRFISVDQKYYISVLNERALAARGG